MAVLFSLYLATIFHRKGSGALHSIEDLFFRQSRPFPGLVCEPAASSGCIVVLQARKKQEAEPKMQQGPWQGLVILGRSSLFIKLTISTMICGVVTEAL